MGFLLFLVYVVLTTTGLVLIKLGGQGTSFQLQQGVFSFSLNVKLILGLLAYVVSFILFAVILNRYELSTIYPIASGVVAIFSVLAGVFILNERVTTMKVAGIALVIIGVLLINFKKV